MKILKQKGFSKLTCEKNKPTNLFKVIPRKLWERKRNTLFSRNNNTFILWSWDQTRLRDSVISGHAYQGLFLGCYSVFRMTERFDSSWWLKWPSDDTSDSSLTRPRTKVDSGVSMERKGPGIRRSMSFSHGNYQNIKNINSPFKYFLS